MLEHYTFIYSAFSHAAKAFDFLDAPPYRVTGVDVPMPYAAHLEQARAEMRMAVAVAQLREQRGTWQRDLARQTGIK